MVQKKEIVVLISDTGPGIRKDDMKKLFGKFAKIEFAYRDKKNIQGTGLGLYITKKIISLHGGAITVESEIGKGAQFKVTFPIKKK